MTPDEIRQALYDIRARQRLGDARQALADRQAQALETRTLEARFLAAAAVADEDARWKAFKALSNDEPRFYWAHAGMASIYAGWGIRDQAEKELAEAERLLPRIAWTETIRGDLNRTLHTHELAQAAYARALALSPKDSDARTGLALSLAESGDASEVEKELVRALTDTPTHYEAALALAQLHDGRGKQAEALAAWKTVAALAPRNRDAQLALARLQSQNPRAAALAYETAARLKPLDLNEHRALASLYERLGEEEKEIESLGMIVRLSPTDPAPLRRLAALHAKRSDDASLERTFRALLALDENDIPSLMGLARAAESKGHILEAFAHLDRAERAGSAAAPPELERLRTRCLLPETPLSAPNLSLYYRRLSESLEKLYDVRRAASPGLAGVLKVRITSDGRGRVTDADIVDDTLDDPWLAAHLVIAARESTLPRLGAGQTRFVLDFDLPPVKK